MTDASLICTVAIELSRARWVVGALPPTGNKVSVGAVPGGDTDRLMQHLNKIQTRLAREFGQAIELKVCFEAGYDGFWLARPLNPPVGQYRRAVYASGWDWSPNGKALSLR